MYLTVACEYDDKYNSVKARDINYLSAPFFHGCIEKAKSPTRGSGDITIASPQYVGIANVIDSLIIVKQFVYDEKIVTMQELIATVQANWSGFENLRTLIIKKGDFFGNDTKRSNSIAQRFYQSLYEFFKDKTNLFGFHWLVGDLIGYNPHHQWFGEKTAATPDGRYTGDALKFGLGQSEGKDRNGLTALLNSIARVDPSAIGCGSTVTNIMLDEQLIKNDTNFNKTADLFETYFKNGGVTLSGGEPLAQYDFSLELLKKAKENGIHTAIETCGYAEKSKILEIAMYVDLFLFDCKETDPELHKKYTGVDNKIILDNLKALSDAGSKIILRCPIIPGFNDRAEHFKEISEIADKLSGIEHIEVEPFHPLGESKYSALSREYADIQIPDTETVDNWIEQIKLGTKKEVKRA